MRKATFDEVRDGERFVRLGAERLRRIALGQEAPPPVRSPVELEAELAELCAGRWAEARARTTPGPFGDPGALERLLSWIEQSDLENVVRVLVDAARSSSATGTEGIHYAFAGLVAVWRGPLEPASVLVGRLPPCPKGKILAQALEAARVFAAAQLARHSDLRRQWEAGPDGGAAYREQVAALQAALG